MIITNNICPTGLVEMAKDYEYEPNEYRVTSLFKASETIRNSGMMRNRARCI